MRLQADICEEGDELIVAIDLSANRPGEIELLVDATLLCLQVEWVSGDRENPERPALRGRQAARLCGHVPLPRRVFPGEVRATVREGVLEVRLSIDKESEDVAHYDLSAGELEPRASRWLASLRRRGREVP